MVCLYVNRRDEDDKTDAGLKIKSYRKTKVYDSFKRLAQQVVEGELAGLLHDWPLTNNGARTARFLYLRAVTSSSRERRCSILSRTDLGSSINSRG